MVEVCGNKCEDEGQFWANWRTSTLVMYPMVVRRSHLIVFDHDPKKNMDSLSMMGMNTFDEKSEPNEVVKWINRDLTERGVR